MGVAEILAGIDLLFSLILRFYNVASTLAGKTPIPTLEEILQKNVELQAKIDAEK
jgi:hypothetical protein